MRNEQHSIAYRLNDADVGGLDPQQLVRLLVGRGTPTNIDCIAKVNALPGGDPSARGRATARDVAVTGSWNTMLTAHTANELRGPTRRRLACLFVPGD